MLLIVSSLLVSSAFAGTLAPGATIDEALTLDVLPAGFEAVEALLPSLLPSGIPIEDTSSGDCWGGFTLSNASVDLEIVSADITPGEGVLDVDISLLVALNDASNPFYMSYELLCFLGETCSGYVDEFEVNARTTIGLDIDTSSGTPALDATVGAIEFDYALDASDIVLSGCSIGSIEEVLSLFGLSLYDLILDLVDPFLQDALAGFIPDLETQVEEAFSAAVIQQELDLNGTALRINLFPSGVDITPEGLRLVMSGSLDADQAECIEDYDPGGSLETVSAAPGIGEVDPTGHFVVQVSDDFTNQALYAAWRGGILCYTIEPGGSLDLPISLDTTLLSGLTGGVYDPLFPESSAVTLRTLPRAAPTLELGGSHDLDLRLNDLDLEMFGELDGRMARFTSVTLNGPVGADLELDPATGELGIALDLDFSVLDVTLAYNEFYPGTDTTVAEAFKTSIGGLIGPILDGVLGDALAFAIPSFSGLGLTEINISNADDWLIASAQLGPVAYGDPTAGCDSEGGCAGGCDEGCSGGCSSDGARANLAAVLGFGLLVLRRRRS